MFQFVEDRQPAGTISGPYRPVADQSKYRSIWGVVGGEQGNHPWTGRQIENGEIYSADGKARLGGQPVKDGDGKFHDISSGKSILREYQVPIKAIESWNAYEAKQAENMEKNFKAMQTAVGDSISRVPQEFSSEIEEVEVEPVSYDKAPGQPGQVKESITRHLPPKRQKAPTGPPPQAAAEPAAA